MSLSHEAILKFVLESKSTESIDFQDFSTHFCIGAMREVVLSKKIKSFFEQNLFLEKSYTKGTLKDSTRGYY
jgi:hypothetical protein